MRIPIVVEQRTGDLPRYEIRVTLDPSEPLMTIDAVVGVPRTLRDPAGLTFTLRADMHDLRVDVDSPVPTVLTPERIGPDGEVGERWRVDLPVELDAFALVRVRFRYHGGASISLNFALSAEGCFGAGDALWYPHFGGGRGFGTMAFDVPAGWQVIATGVRGNERREPTFTTPWPSDFGFAAGPFRIHRDEGKPRVELFLLTDHAFAAELVRICRSALEVLEREFGPYPFGDFAVVEAPTGPAAKAGFIGAAYEGFMLVRSDFLAATGADAAHFGHEIGHQWWGHLVQRAGERGDYMLDEALAQFAGLRVVESIRGPEAAVRMRRGVEGLGGGRHATRLIAADLGQPLGSLIHGPAGYALSDSKGYLVWDLLARTIGRDRFRAALASVTAKHAFDRITWEEFLAVLAEFAEQDLSGFYRQWFERPDLPVLSVEHDTAARSWILQHTSLYTLDLPIRVQRSDGTVLDSMITIRDARTPVGVAGSVEGTILVDPDYQICHATPPDYAHAQALAHHTRGELLWNNGQTDEALTEYREGLKHLPSPDTYGIEARLRLGIGWIAEEAGDVDDAVDQYEQAIALAVRPPEALAQLYLRLAKCHVRSGASTRARWAAEQALAAEQGDGRETRISLSALAILRETGGPNLSA